MKKHIVTFGPYDFAVDSVSAATQAVALLSKMTPVRFRKVGEKFCYQEEERDRTHEVKLELNKEFMPLDKPKPEPKALALPKPKRGTILCICEKSHVAPRETCPHCGRDFSESHNRAHSSKNEPHLRLI
jgi:hypothetical protein